MFDLILAIIWAGLGAYTLYSKREITRLDYGCVWFVVVTLLVCEGIKNLIQ